MRERLTFIHGADDEFKSEQIRLQNEVLHLEAIKGAREDRYTFGLYELPQEVYISPPFNIEKYQH